jgi:divalent metal cation (Fe/Co/Zn/Cd) transporter
LTSGAAIVALVAGKFLGWAWLDPVMGIAGAALIARWAVGLARETTGVLLDEAAHPAERRAHQAVIERPGTRAAGP